MNVLIFLGGEKPSHTLSRIAAARADLVIAADSGYDATTGTGIQPDIVTGDFDSIEASLEEVSSKVIPAPEQDATDFQKALQQVPEGVHSIEILGGTGLRSDHFLTNLLIAAGLPPQIPVVFHDDTQSIYRISQELPFAKTLRPETTLSLIPFAHCSGVTTSGLHWDLAEAEMGPDGQLGQSNSVEKAKVSVSVGTGILFAVVNHPNGLDAIEEAAALD